MSLEGPIANLLSSSQVAGSKKPQHVLVVDTSGNPATFGGSGGTSSTDSGTFTATTTVGTPAMGAYESTPDQLTSGQLGIIGLDIDRNVKVNVVAGGTAGTQYTEGDTDASITGTALMLEGAANALVAAPGTAADGMLVNLGANNDVVVTNAGTFATQVDGAALTALQIIDDWDESDRAKVNPIVGQAGVAAGAGASGATTQRVILATDGQPGASAFATNQVSVANTATLIVASRAGRRSAGVVNHGTTAVYLGPANTVTTSNGLLLPGTVGAAVSLDYSGDVYGIVASGTQTVSYGEEY